MADRLWIYIMAQFVLQYTDAEVIQLYNYSILYDADNRTQYQRSEELMT